MEWEVAASSTVTGNLEGFREALNVWIQRPNVCAKSVSCTVVERFKNPPDDATLLEFLEKVDEPCNSNVLLHDVMNKCRIEPKIPYHELVFRKLIPRKPSIHLPSYELIACCDSAMTFIPVTGDFQPKFDEVSYRIYYIDNLTLDSHRGSVDDTGKPAIVLSICDAVNCSEKYKVSKSCAPSKNWLVEKLLPALTKWTVTPCSHAGLPQSLSLIPQIEYAETYDYLKEKYGKELVKIWPEVTDPQKYIFEDIAIATYLILLWKKERLISGGEKQSFIDLGCGNGLLVYILNSEGHPGKGVDIRKRKIWDFYPDNINLVESVVDPTSCVSYSEFDWLLGNHSDELTPWLPVMAARSGYHVRYWVLPCCFHDFYDKYRRADSTSSQYHDYLNFVESVGRMCGFEVEVDVMRIPSTKRVCHVGMRKVIPLEEHDETLCKVESFIESRKGLVSSFEAREKVEKVKNCTKLEKSVQAEVVNLIVKKLLETSNFVVCEPLNQSISSIDIDKSVVTSVVGPVKINPCSVTEEKTFRTWNLGGSISLKEAAALLDNHQKAAMKNECGGLQSLLRNHHQIFEVISGNVKIRDWTKSSTSRQKRKNKNKSVVIAKTRPCWFYVNHPDGCPRNSASCPFLHCS